MKLIDRIFNKLAYKYSKDRVEQIEAIDREIKRCDEGIEMTKKLIAFRVNGVHHQTIMEKNFIQYK